jgi:hypothetical protein
MAKIKGILKTRFYDGWRVYRYWNRIRYHYLGDPYFQVFRAEHHTELEFSMHHYEVTWTFRKKQLCDKGCCYR